MRNRFEQNFFNSETPEENETQPEKNDDIVVEEEPAVEIQEHVAKRFSELEELVEQIYFENGETVSIAGVAIDQESISPEFAEEVKSLKEHVHSILSKTARTTLKTAGVLAISTGLLLGYAVFNLEKPEHFRDKDRARQELVEKGITSEQRYSAYKPGISEMVYRGVNPLGYQNLSDPDGFFGGFFSFLENKGIPNTHIVQQFIPNLALGRQYRAEKYEEAQKAEQHVRAIKEGYEEKQLAKEEKQRLQILFNEFAQKKYQEAWGSDMDLQPPANPETQKALDDAWRLYLGLPQQYNSFDISEYKPAKDTEDKYYYKINKFWDAFLSEHLEKSYDFLGYTEFAELPEDERKEFIRLKSTESGLKGKIELIQKFGKNGKFMFEGTEVGEDGGDVMYHYTVSLGKDEKGSYISYYDKWDLASFLSQNVITRGVGQPFEIYDRLYYDPVTFEVVKDTSQ